MDQYIKEIKTSIEKFEGKTGAEIVVILGKKSHNYFKPILFPGPVAAGLLTWMMYTKIVFSVFTITITVTLFLLLSVFLLLLLPKLRLVFYSNKQICSFVESSAHEYFSRKTVYETTDRCGILLYYSLLEKKAVVLPDKGIKLLVSSSESPDVFKNLEASVNTSGIAGIPSKLIETAEILGAIYPWDETNENELSDEPYLKKD